MQYTEVYQDLFTVDNSYVFAHCISQDCAMGAGIAVEFVKRLPYLRESIRMQNPQIGDAVFYHHNGFLLYNLITKKHYYNKPTYKTFQSSIETLRDAMLSQGFKKLAIPQIGAGIDRLNWSKNSKIIQTVFDHTDIEILVCKLK